MKRSYLFGALLLSTRLAWAGDPTTSDGWYEVGQTHFTLGEFDKAVDAFKKGFELETDDEKKPAYLYNIAQSYRQANDCKNAVFFYKRFIAMKANDAKKPLKPELKTEVEGHIKDGEDCIAKMDAARTKPSDHTLSPADDAQAKHDPNPDPNQGKPKQVAVTDTGNNTSTVKQTDDQTGIDKSNEGPPHLLSATLLGGGAKISAGSLSIPVSATGTLVGGYPLPINDKLELVVGAAFTFTNIGYQDINTTASRSAQLVGLLANAAAEYTVAPKISVRGDAGVGVLLFTGLDQMGSPFTQDGAGTSGALTMLHVRAAVSGSYAITSNISATLTPFAFSYSPPKSGLRDDIKSITAIDFMVGVGYRM